MSVRVAVTGVGLRTPAGHDVSSTMDTLLSARSTAAVVDALAEAGSPVIFACTVPEFDLAPYCSRRELLQIERTTALALVAAVDAVDNASVEWPADRSRVGVSIGIGMGGLAAAEQVVRDFGQSLRRVPAFTVPRLMANSVAARISMRIGARGPALTYAAACASGAVAIGEAMLRIRHDQWDVAVAGGADSGVTPLMITAFAHSGALSRRNETPGAASRPFDADRDGFVMSEGAAMLVLERWDRATARGAAIIGEVVGFAANSDAFHVVAPIEDGSVAAECMRQALADAGVGVSDIGHINAHGTSTVLNDRAEAHAVSACFGDRCPPVTAPKSVVGHMIGGAGAFEAIVSVVTANSGLVPPVANFVGSDLSRLVDVVAGSPRAVAPSFVLSNSFGFGGHNACLVLGPGAG